MVEVTSEANGIETKNGWAPRSISQIDTDLPNPDPEGKITYRVKKGDTLGAIVRAVCRRYKLKTGQNVKTIAVQSGIKNPNLIRPGEVITIYVKPVTATTPTQRPILLASADNSIPIVPHSPANQMQNPSPISFSLKDLDPPESIFKKIKKEFKKATQRFSEEELEPEILCEEIVKRGDSRKFEHQVIELLLMREMGTQISISDFEEIFSAYKYVLYLEEHGFEREIYTFPKWGKPLLHGSPFWVTKLVLILTISLDQKDLLTFLLKTLATLAEAEKISQEELKKLLIELLKNILSEEETNNLLVQSNKKSLDELSIEELQEIISKHAQRVAENGLPRTVRYKILKALLSYYEKPGDLPLDPSLKGEILYHLANSTQDPEEAQRLFESAKQELDTVINQDQEFKTNKEIRSAREKKDSFLEIIIKRITYNKSVEWSPWYMVLTFGEIRNIMIPEFNRCQGTARRLLAEIYLREVGTLIRPEEKTKKLEDILKILQEAQAKVSGFELLAVQQLMAEVLFQMASLSKDPQERQSLINSAREIVKRIEKWGSDYLALLKKENPSAVTPFWLGEILSRSRLVLAKLLLLENKLDEAIEILKEIAKTKHPNQELRAEASLLLAKIYLEEKKLTEAEKILQKLANSAQTNPELRAEASLLLAKIYLEEKKLTEAEESIKKAVATPPSLIPTTLSSAHQTYGDILSAQGNFAEAEKQYRKALEVWEENHLARVSLGDILNWRGDYAGAREEYQKVPPDHPTYHHAQLGLREIKMREDEIYSNESIEELEAFAEQINKNAPSSFLIPRAIEDLIEAYGTNEDYQEKIMELIDQHKDNPHLAPHFRVKLYLKRAEVLSWIEKYEEALGTLSQIPAELQAVITNQDANHNYTNPELKAYYDLLMAEIKMRQGERSHLFVSSLEQTVFQSKNPELVARLVLDRIESYSRERNYKGMAEEIRKYLAPQNLAKVQELFSVRGQNLYFLKFKLKLHRKLAEALQWNKKYELALVELDTIDAEVNEAERSNYLSPKYITLLRAWVRIRRGEIYLSDWEKKNFSLATQNFNEAINLLKDINPRSKEANVTLAWAYFGLGEVYRYGNKNYENSRANYLKAKEIAETLPEKSDDRVLLLARISLGLAKLEEMNGNPDLAVRYYKDATHYCENIPKCDLSEWGDVSSSTLSRSDPLLEIASRTMSGPDGRKETRLSLIGEIPLDFIPELRWLHLTLNQQLDLAQDSQLYSPYLGAKIYFDTLCRTLSSDDNPICANFIPLTLEIKGKLGTFGKSKDSRFFRRPDLGINTSLSWKHINIYSEINLDFQDKRLNTYYAGIQISPFAGSSNELLSALSLIVDYNNFNFTYLGDFRKRHQFGLGIKWEPDITSWLKLIAEAQVLSYLTQQTAETGTGPLQWWKNNWGAKFGLGLRFNLGRYGEINLFYTREQNPEYPLNTFGASLNITF